MTTTTESLVAGAIAGDVEAFGQLVARYQGMAFTYALTTTRDWHMAEDATQQALITAYRNLPSLREPRRFGGWLRGIVRFECLRMRRECARWHTDSLDADDAVEPIDTSVDLEHQAEVSGELNHVLALMAHLPERQRVVAHLYYLGDQSQAAVAEFLGLSVSAVNNRLREARAVLRQEGASMSLSSMNTPDFATTIGRVIRANDATIDASIAGTNRPPLLTAVQVGERERAVVAFVSQYLNDDVARLVVVDGTGHTPRIVRGTSVRSNGEMTDFSASADVIDRLVGATGGSDASVRIPTGIKVIDLFAPLVNGGTIALVGAMNVGKLVVVEELVARLIEAGRSATILVFLKTPDELGVVHQLTYRVDGKVGVVVVPVADASPEALASGLTRVDTMLAMSQELGAERLYPAIDPLASRAVSGAGSDLAERARAMLRADEGNARARLLRAYLTQRFFVAQPFTGRPGVSVELEVTEADVARILEGDVNGLTAEALAMGASLAAIGASTPRS